MFTFNFEIAIKDEVGFKEEFGTSVAVFFVILGFIEATSGDVPKQGARSRIPTTSKLCCFLYYIKNYPSMRRLRSLFGISVSYICILFMKYRVILLNCGILKLKGIGDSKVILIDGTETPVQRPKVDSVDYYGRKKCFTIKSQIIVDGDSKKVLSIHTCRGSIHDFQLFKLSDLSIPKDCGVIVDSGYIGIKKYHEKSVHPLKKPKNGNLTQEQKEFSTKVSRIRVINENVIGKLKFFKLMAGKFRYCKYLIPSFWSYSCIIAGIYNLNLSLN